MEKKILKKIFKEIKNGGLVISSITNQHLEAIAETILKFEDGEWKLEKINCYSSSWLGLGGCQCNSHPVWREDEISRDYALKLIRKYISEKIEDEEKRKKEIEFFDRLVRLAEAGE